MRAMPIVCITKKSQQIGNSCFTVIKKAPALLQALFFVCGSPLFIRIVCCAVLEDARR